MELKDRVLHWETGKKDGIGTALSDRSQVYFTIGDGHLTETYFPSPDSIVLHSIKFFLGGELDETLFPFTTEIIDDFSPLYRTTTNFKSGKVEKEIVVNPDASALFVRYKFFHLSNLAGIFKVIPVNLSYHRMISKTSLLLKTGNTFIFIKMDKPFEVERVENFLLLHLSKIENGCDMMISFGKTKEEAYVAASETEKKGFDVVKRHFISGWKNYLNGFNLFQKGELYKRSLITLKSMEDKVFKGATVASLSIPWGSKATLDEKNGYHLVWVRDLFFTALAMHLAGDSGFANSALEYMVNILMRDDGSFKQNTTILGEERWNASQMDQISFPIILANKLGRNDLTGELEKSVDYIVKNGPWSEQERWEEIAGYSPYTMSLEARALSAYSDMRRRAGLSGKVYKNKAEEFAKLIPEYCYAKNGIFSPYNYFVRISAGDPNTEEKKMFLKGKYFSPKEMISADFLYLVFTGLYDAKHPFIQNSVEAVDSLLKVGTGKGVSFYRYNGDVYGFDNPAHPEGKLWVFLTAERGIFELMRGNDARKYLTAIEQFAAPTYLLSEQVFEDGTPTESATPLAWSHASYIILYELINNPSLLLETCSLF